MWRESRPPLSGTTNGSNGARRAIAARKSSMNPEIASARLRCSAGGQRIVPAATVYWGQRNLAPGGSARTAANGVSSARK